MANKTVEQKLNEGRQYRSFDLDAFEQRAEDGSMTVKGYATTFGDIYTLMDYGDYVVRERVDEHAFDGCDMSDVIMQYDHQGRVFARTGNNTLAIAADERGLAMEAELSGTEIGRQLYEEIAGKYTTKMSMGFRVAEDVREITEDRENNRTEVLRTITKISKLYDVSAVSLPANDATSISARNYSDGVVAELLEELETRKARDRQKKKIRILAEMEV